MDEDPVGIIYPPPDLRGIVDSTAKYVAKNGAAFEDRIKREHRDKPKFSFLFSEDPFNAYYQHKVREIRNSLLSNLNSAQQNNQDDGDDNKTANNDTAERDSPSRAKNSSDTNPDGRDRSPIRSSNDQEQDNEHERDDEGTQTGPKVRMKLNDYIQEMSKKLEEPPKLNYLATPASGFNQMECDIIKLTSQYISMYGRSFLFELVSREHNDSRFDFLKPQHGQFTYMMNLIMQYALIRNPPLDIVEQLELDASSQSHVLDKIKARAEWDRMLEYENKKREEAEERERLLYSQIDWHDFAIVETIDYQAGDVGEYPPTTADMVGTRLLLQQKFEEKTAPEEMDIDMDVGSDGDSVT